MQPGFEHGNTLHFFTSKLERIYIEASPLSDLKLIRELFVIQMQEYTHEEQEEYFELIKKDYDDFRIDKEVSSELDNAVNNMLAKLVDYFKL